MAKEVHAGVEGYPSAENFSDFTEITGWEDQEGKPPERHFSGEEAGTLTVLIGSRLRNSDLLRNLIMMHGSFLFGVK